MRSAEIWSSQRREACGKEPDTRRSRYACIVEAHESTRNRLERTLPKITKIALLRGVQFIESLQTCDFPMPQAMKIPDAQAAVDKECEKLPNFASMANDQGQEQKRGHQRGTERREDSSVCYANGHLPSQKKIGVETKIPKIQGTSVKYDSGSCAICTEQGSAASITNDGRKSCGWCSTAVSMRRTSSRCSISLYPGENGGCFSIVELPKSECPDIWTRLPRYTWPKSWSSMGRCSRSS